MSDTHAILEILESLPTHPQSGQILGALTRAERAGFERGLRAAEERIREQDRSALEQIVGGSPLLSRQAG